MEKLAAITIRHWKSLLALNVLVLAAVMGKVAVSPKVWTAKAQLILPETTSNLDASLGTLGSMKNTEIEFSSQVNPLKVQASILTSEALLRRLWNSDPEKDQVGFGSYKKLFEVTPEEQSTIVSLAVSGSSPEIARQRATALTEAYQQRLNELRQADGAARGKFSQKELEQAQQNLKLAEIELAQFKKASGLVNSEEQTRGMVSTLTDLTNAQAQAEAQARASENQVRTLSARLSLNPEQAIRSVGLGENQDYQFVRGKLSEVEAALVKNQATFTNEHPTVRKLLTQRNELQSQLQQYVSQAAGNTTIDSNVTVDKQGRAALIGQLVMAESEASAQQRKAIQLQQEIDKLNASLKLLPANQARLLELQRQYDVAEGVYKGLVAQVKQAKIDAFNAYPNVQVLDPPNVGATPTDPKLKLAILSGLLASIIGSIALVLLLEGRNPLLSPKDLQAIKFPIVVRIPRLRHSGMGLELGTETEVEFQRLASAISMQPLKDRRLLITSPIVGEGKTTVTLGLATALADLGFRVL
ncbi:MAG: GNVR domain-containing protein, partial [Cyanobacteriota bacterium]